MAVCLGLDTSNYTTSAAVFGDGIARNKGRLLDVPAGTLGLRQSDAVFQHVKRLHLMVEALREEGCMREIAAVGASVQPRALENSYMPCFLVGAGQGQALAAALGVPFFPCSHQQGHIAAAAWSAGRQDLLDSPHLAWHLSGGTTELLLVRPEGANVKVSKLGGTSDISAGQLIDRAGVLLGLPFPAGKALDCLYESGNPVRPFPVKVNDCTFSLSGMENQVKALAASGGSKADVACFVLDTVSDTVARATRAAQAKYPGLSVLCSGGVASNRRLREVMSERCGALFARPEYSTDNALGVAILAQRALSAGAMDEGMPLSRPAGHLCDIRM